MCRRQIYLRNMGTSHIAIASNIQFTYMKISGIPVAGDAVAGHDSVSLDEAGRDALPARRPRRRVANQVTHLL